MASENPVWFGREPKVRLEQEHGPHSIGDQCPAIVLHGGFTNVADFFKSMQYSLHFRRSEMMLKKFLDSLQTDTEPLADFSVGSTFDPNEYPVGTILRLKSELDWHETKFPEEVGKPYDNAERVANISPPLIADEEYEDRLGITSSFGIIAKEPDTHTNCVIQQSGPGNIVSLDKRDNINPSLLVAPYQIGDWVHQIWLSWKVAAHHDKKASSDFLGNIPNILGFRPTQDDIFYRFTDIKIIEIGAGVKERSHKPIVHPVTLFQRARQSTSGN